MVGYLRLILAALVVYSHLNYPLWTFWEIKINQGVFAVFAFYLISGFFTAAIFDRHLGENQLRNFYIDRTLRIYPLFLAAIIITGLIGLVYHEPSLRASPDDYRDPYVWFMAVLQPFNGLVSFLLQGDFPYGPFFAFTPVASLALEVKYFAIYPAIRHYSYSLIALILLACFVLLARSMVSGDADVIEDYSYRFLVGVLPTFLVGFLIYRNQHEPAPFWLRGEILSLVFGISLWFSIHLLNPVSTRWVGEMGLALILTPSLLMLALRITQTKLDALAGYISYGVFLVHIPVIRFLHLKGDSVLEFFYAIFIAIAISLVLHFLVERKVLAIRHKMGKLSEIRIAVHRRLT